MNLLKANEDKISELENEISEAEKALHDGKKMNDPDFFKQQRRIRFL